LECDIELLCSAEIVELLARQKQRRGEQIYDERMGSVSHLNPSDFQYLPTDAILEYWC
jgi:hypothetical protein